MLKGRDKEDKGVNKIKIKIEDIESGAFFITEDDSSCDILIVKSIFEGEYFMVNASVFIKISSSENIEAKEGIVNWLNKRDYEKREARIVLD